MARIKSNKVKDTDFRRIGRRDVASMVGSSSIGVDKASIPGISYERSLFRLAAKVAGKDKVTEPFEESPWVHFFLRAGALAVKQVKGFFWDSDPRESRDAEKVGEDHPLQRLIRRPNPLTTEAELWESAYLNRMLDGEDFWILTDGDKMNTAIGGENILDENETLEFGDSIPTPSRIWSVRGRNVELFSDSGGTPRYWKIPFNGATRNIPFESVVQFRNYDPRSPLRGIGPIQVLASEFDLELKAKQAQGGLFDNGGTPGVYITKKSSLDQSVYKLWQRRFSQRFKRGDLRGAPFILDNFEDMDLHFPTARASDLEFQETYKDVRQKVGGATRIPETALGLMDRAILRNFEATAKVLWVVALIPELLVVEDVINNRLLPRIDSSERGSAEVFRFDFESIPALQGDNLDLVNAAVELVARVPGMSWHEALLVVGHESENVSEGDRKYVPSGFVSLEKFDEQGGSTSAPPPPPPKAPKAESEPAKQEPKKDLVVQSYFLEGVSPENAKSWAEQRGIEWIPEKVSNGYVLEQRPPDEFETGSLEAGGVGEVSMIVGHLKDGIDPILSLQRGRAQARLRMSLSVDDDDDSDPDPVDEVEVARASAWKSIAAKAFSPWEPKLMEANRRFQGAYRRAQITRLEAFARGDERSVKTGEEIVSATSLTAADIEAILLDVEEWRGKAVERYAPILDRIFEAASAQAAEEIGAVALEANAPGASEFLRKQTFKMVDHTNGTIREAVRSAMLKEFNQSTSVGTLREIVSELLPNLRDGVRESFKNRQARAQAIARTETATAVNAARTMTFEDGGVSKHEWLSSRDDATRETHGTAEDKGLDGEVRRIGQEFRSNLKYPGDIDAPPGERINCRCLTIPVIEEDDDE